MKVISKGALLVVLSVLLCAVSGCGQKKPLFMPQKASDNQVTESAHTSDPIQTAVEEK